MSKKQDRKANNAKETPAFADASAGRPEDMTIQDRMMRYSMYPPCPACGANSTVCNMRRGLYARFTCRECGHRWEVR